MHHQVVGGSEADPDRDVDLASAATEAEPGVRRRKQTERPVSRGSVVGRYVVLDELGAGGMGVVYAAWDPELNRRVALKLVLSKPGSGSGGVSRIQREAQALARLSHPNVVAIYDVGTIGDHVFLAMELVEGELLSTWLEKKPTWREVVNAFREAGRGLAAAHAAGMVHRDFKPNNVIVGSDGRVRVLDFGLARAGAQTTEERPALQQRRRAHRDSLDVALTQEGSLLGTPLYMSPEALRGDLVTEAGDQFSFSVAFHEGLYGVRPFDHMFDEKLPPVVAPPADTRVPAWVRRIVLRGLAERVQDRFPSMAALLEALDDDPAIKRRRWLVGGGVTAVLGAGVALALHSRGGGPPDPCKLDAPFASTWDKSARESLHAAFVATKVPGAEDSFGHTAAALDETATNWLDARRDACADTRERHSASEAALLLRLACLDRQKDDVSALVELLQRPDAKLVDIAALAVRELPGPVVCANARSLSYVEPPPPALRWQVTELHHGLSRSNALMLVGREKDAGAQLLGLVEQANKLGYRPVLAEAQYLFGRQKLDDFEAAIHYLDEAEATAVAARVDTIAARAAAARLAEGAIAGRSREVVDAWTQRARAWIERENDVEATFAYEESLGILAENGGDHAGAVTHLTRAIELGTREFGAASARVFGIEATLAFTLVQLGEYDKAIAMLGPAIETFERAYGASSVRLRDALDNYGLALAMVGRFADARRSLERALAMSSEVDMARGAVLCDLGRVAVGEGRIEDAIELGERGIAMLRALHVEKANLAINSDPLAAAYAAAGRPSDALVQSRDCLSEFAKASNEGVDTVACLTIEGTALLDLGNPEEALPVLERALKLQTGHPAPPGVVANIQFQVARALVATNGDTSRARTLAEQARTELSRYAFKKHDLVALDAWRSHSLP
jgi:tetratricopeptide (TPR) repeat protein